MHFTQLHNRTLPLDLHVQHWPDLLRDRYTDLHPSRYDYQSMFKPVQGHGYLSGALHDLMYLRNHGGRTLMLKREDGQIGEILSGLSCEDVELDLRDHNRGRMKIRWEK